VAIGACGYVLFLAELFGAGKLVAMVFGDKMSMLLLWYGLYFGILGRDTAEVAFSGLVRTASFPPQRLSNHNRFMRTSNAPHSQTSCFHEREVGGDGVDDKMPLLLLWYRLYFGILGRGTAKGLSLALCVNCLFFA
jgi:hypothetical protein